ncbi:SRPBCC family protein [Microbacterium sp. TPD7012]|uniref:SRPBCC family protein n=1 Tax=Microbacterium sp. TPD7012 TaxID=2171975 RepID=UPI000D515273|nr:SRPBCC family protein [Microbacterium sp. TPD7012]PVE95517.1 ATPase [Microbacterium sp. TPD7012]
MNAPAPTGRLVPAADGQDLVFARTLPGSLEDSWASITEPERTARWIGAWEGEGAVGATIRLRLGFEEESPWADVRITECDRPRRLRVLSIDEAGAWDVSMELTPAGERTELRFTMHAVDATTIGDVGPGWEWYLDQLIASMSDAPLPPFEDYYPAQREYFAALAR